jgi:hypothetical protein
MRQKIENRADKEPRGKSFRTQEVIAKEMFEKSQGS